MKKSLITVFICALMLLPGGSVSAKTDQQNIEQLKQVLSRLLQQLELLKKQSAGVVVSPKSGASYASSDVKKITYQEVYDDGRNAIYRYEITLANNQKLVVSVPKKASATERLKAFKASGFTGSDVKEVTRQAKLLPGLRWQTCDLKSDKKTYDLNKPITLTWSTDAKYVAFNTYGSSDKKEYVDETFRDSSGEITIKIDTPGRHYINMNVYPWKERFASGACTVSFDVGNSDDTDSDDDDHELPDDPILGYFIVEPSRTVQKNDMITLRYSVEKSDRCGIFAESGSNKTTVLAKARNNNLRISNVALPEWATSGSSFNYVLRCDSWSNAYYKSQVDALENSITVQVVK